MANLLPILLSKKSLNIIVVVFFVFTILGLNYFRGKANKLSEENKKLREQLALITEKYNICQKSMDEIKIDYNKRIKEYVRKLNNTTKYDRLKQIPYEAEGGKDECEEIKKLLEIYRDVESSGYIRNRINRELRANGEE